MNDIQVHDNFLTQTEYEALYNAFKSHEVNWYYDDFINSPVDDDSDYNFQFVHPIYHYNENGPLFLEDSKNWDNRLRLIKSSHKAFKNLGLFNSISATLLIFLKIMFSNFISMSDSYYNKMLTFPYF